MRFFVVAFCCLLSGCATRTEDGGPSDDACVFRVGSRCVISKVEDGRPARSRPAPFTMEQAKQVNQLSDKVQQDIDNGRYAEALPNAKLVAQMIEKFGLGEFPRALTLHQLITIYLQLGYYDEALPLLRDVEKMCEKNLYAPAINGVNATQAAATWHSFCGHNLNNFAVYYSALGIHDKAAMYLEKHESLCEKIQTDNSSDASYCFYGFALPYLRLGFYNEGLSYLQRALEIDERDRREDARTANILFVLGCTYQRMGNYDAAIKCLERAKKIMDKFFGTDYVGPTVVGAGGEKLGHIDQISIVRTMADVYGEMGAFDKAIPLYEQVLAKSEKVYGSDDKATKDGYGRLGLLYLKLKDYNKAEYYITRSKISSVRIELRLAEHKFIDAHEALNSVRHFHGTQENPSSMIWFNTAEGEAFAGLDQYGNAASSFLQAVQIIEKLRGRVGGAREDFFQTGDYQGGYIRSYRGLVFALAEAAKHNETISPFFDQYGGNPASAGFYFAESTKARKLLETMSKEAGKTIHAVIPDDLKQKEQKLISQLSALEKQAVSASVGFTLATSGKKSAGLQEVESRQEKLTREFDQFVSELRKSYPAYAALHYPKPVLAENLPLKPQEVLVEYAVGANSLCIFVVRKGKIDKLITVPIDEEQLNKKVNAFLRPLLNQKRQGFSTAQAKEIYDLIFAPALTLINKNEEVLIVPDGVLGLLPFEALVMQEGTGANDALYVGDNYSIRYYQSAAILALNRTLKQSEPVKPLFALGNPLFAGGANSGGSRSVASVLPNWDAIKQPAYENLPETEDEVKNIANFFGVPIKPPDILLGADASENILNKEQLQDYRYLHFATHADLQGSIPGINEPFLLLSQVGKNTRDRTEGFFTLSKVMGLKLSADMVVLSACQTGRGEIITGEGVVNFARAFQQAGAQSVVVSLWRVSSVETVDYMIRFYGYIKSGKSRSEALRLARNEMKAKYQNPFYWAPFIIHGDG